MVTNGRRQAQYPTLPEHIDGAADGDETVILSRFLTGVSQWHIDLRDIVSG
jgi:hypothetical protein